MVFAFGGLYYLNCTAFFHCRRRRRPTYILASLFPSFSVLAGTEAEPNNGSGSSTSARCE